MAKEEVAHPSHYNQGTIEVVTFLEDQKLNHYLATAVTYICRAEHKGQAIKDLEKARWYLTREIQRRKYPALVSKDADTFDARDRIDLGLIRRFHETFGVPIGGSFEREKRRNLRRDLLAEEYGEYVAAERANNWIEIADALADMVVIIAGTALEYGLPLGPIFAEVMRTNLAKAGPDGVPVYREDGKILKPAGWSPPDIKGTIDRVAKLISAVG